MKYIFFAIVVGVFLSGCVDETLIHDPDNVPDGMALLSCNLNMPSAGVVNTRSTQTDPSTTEQDLSGNVVVMVFDSNNPQTAKLKQAPVSGLVKGGNTLTALLKTETTESYICIAANITDANRDYLLGLTAAEALVNITARLELTVSAAAITSPLPMSGWSGAIDRISKNTASNISVTLLHSVGRIDVDAVLSGFKIHGVQLVNGAKKGWLLPQETLPYFGETDVVTYQMVELAVPATTFTEKLYCFENAGMRGSIANPTRVVIKGQRAGVSSPSFYAIDIVYKEMGGTSDKYDIERNKIYTIRLNKVDKDGYSSYEQAAKSEAFNKQIESDIVVTDPYAYNIVTNGKQYMGITNSKFVLYPMGANTTVSDLLAATISYTCDPGWSEGAITAPPGITLVTDRLEVQHGSVPLYKDIIIKSIASGFTAGVIVVHIGNLRQEIEVTVKPPTQATGQIIDDYFAAPNRVQDYKVGEIIAPTAQTAWLKVSSSDLDEGGSSLNDKITHPEGGIYVHVQPNIGFDTSARPREGSLFVSGTEEHQRTRIYVQQDKFDIYSGKKQIQPFSYVGTFHRWNQTAERLIRIDASKSLQAGGDVWWQATVVAGREFIVLSTDISPDRGINCNNNPYGVGDDPSFKTDEAIEANCQVKSVLRTVQGTSSYIYFKVGLTGRLGGPTAVPRYGLIALTYGSGAVQYGTHNIYVRQGEATDYLMRPWDASTTPIDPTTGGVSRPNDFPSSTRPKAVKFGVYNLTDPSPTTADVSTLGTRGYNFVQYPSQGGYYFLASGTEAIKPTAGWKLSNLNDPPEFSVGFPWKPEWETCPRGYRRPDDGKDRLTRSGGVVIDYPDDIENSEVRQSLWLFPLHKVERSDFSNQIQGYLADGFFDRRPIQTFEADVSLPDMVYGIVEKGTVNAAYWGFLAFNPHNYASLFVPLNGSYREEGAKQGGVGQGKDGSFQTRTSGGSVNDGWIVACGYFLNAGSGQENYVFDTYEKSTARTGYSIRCVKDEQPPVGTDDSQVEIPTEGGGAMVVNLSHTVNGQSIEQQITAKYTVAQIQKTATIAINAKAALSDADYLYLNSWANKTDHQLRHIVIRGADNIPANAFTSSRWYTISCVDGSQITAGAFTASLTGLKQLLLPCLDAIVVASGAFEFTTTGVQLFLRGKEYNERVGKEWKGKTWKEIKKY